MEKLILKLREYFRPHKVLMSGKTKGYVSRRQNDEPMQTIYYAKDYVSPNVIEQPREDWAKQIKENMATIKENIEEIKLRQKDELAYLKSKLTLKSLKCYTKERINEFKDDINTAKENIRDYYDEQKAKIKHIAQVCRPSHLASCVKEKISELKEDFATAKENIKDFKLSDLVSNRASKKEAKKIFEVEQRLSSKYKNDSHSHDENNIFFSK